jgi:hypothetical protein
MIYKSNDLWGCSFQDGYCASAGNLDDCIEFVENYILSEIYGRYDELINTLEAIGDKSAVTKAEERRNTEAKLKLSRIRQECLEKGEAAGENNWWAIWHEEGV